MKRSGGGRGREGMRRNDTNYYVHAKQRLLCVVECIDCTVNIHVQVNEKFFKLESGI